MSDKTLIDFDPVTLTREDLHDDGDKLVLQTRQDVTGIVESNQQQRNAQDRHTAWRGKNPIRMTKFASVPAIDVIELVKMGILSKGFKVLDPRRFQRWLNTREDCKTTPGSAF